MTIKVWPHPLAVSRSQPAQTGRTDGETTVDAQEDPATAG